MTQSVTKKGYARGIGEYLQRTGTIQIPTATLLKRACDEASHLMHSEPAYEGVTHEEVIKVGQALVAFSDELRSQGKVASDGHVQVIGHNAQTAVGDLVEKLARDVTAAYENAAGNTSSTVTGKRTDQANLESDSVNAEAALDAHRPEGYAVVGQGNANFSEPAAARVGTEQKHPHAPTGVGGASGNSVTQASKAAAAHGVYGRLAKLAEGYAGGAGPSHGTTIVGGDPDQQNLESDAVNAEAAMDLADRPEGYAVVGQGNAGIGDVPAGATTGEESKHPKAPTQPGGATSNSVTEASNKMAGTRFQRHFAETAREIEPRLPRSMPMQQKVAAVKEAMRLEPHEVDEFVEKIAQAYARPPVDTVGSMLESIGALSNGG